VVVCTPAVWKTSGSNLTLGSCVYHYSHCDIQPQAWRCLVWTLIAVPMLTQPFTLRGTVKWVSASGLSNNNKWRWWMQMVVPLPSDSQSKLVRLIWRLAWPPGAQSTFIKWTTWTLSMTEPWRQHHKHYCAIIVTTCCCCSQTKTQHKLEMWANAQRDGCPAKYRWRPLFNAAKFGWCRLLDAVQ